jgi:hypothetical protein
MQGSEGSDSTDAAPTSVVLLAAVRGETDTVTLGEIAGALHARGFGLSTLLFSIPSLLPMPPGLPTLVGVALLVVSIQMVIGRTELWLPAFLSRHRFPRKMLVSGFEKVTPYIEAAERVARPRLSFMTGKAATVGVGVVVLIMAIVLILPLPPGGNFPPALACAVLGLGLAQRDGLIVLIGLVASVAATAAVSLVTVVFLKSLPALVGLFPKG